MNIPYIFHEKLILRSPRLPFIHYLNSDILNDLLQNKVFLEAIYLASPVLYDECIKLKEGKLKTEKEVKKLTASLIKYYQRMFTRCTPFGLFSGCAIVNWDDRETKVLYTENDIFRSTRLDMHFLCALAQKLALIPVIKNRIQYYPNSSIYKMADEAWYVEYKYVNIKREHRISAVLYSDYLLLILQNAIPGITIGEMVHLLVLKAGVTSEEATIFVNELIEGQILVNALEPAITGNEFLEQILEILNLINPDKNVEITDLIISLETIKNQIKKIDATLNNDVGAYKQIIEEIKKLDVPFEEGKLFQTDLFRKPANNIISNETQQSLLKAFSFLNGLYSQNTNDNLTAFAKKFQDRYDEKEVPLLSLLDAETGIGYAFNVGEDISPLLEDLSFPSNNIDKIIRWNKPDMWFLKKLKIAFKEDLYEIEISEDDIKQFTPSWKDLPPSVSVIFKLVENNKVVLNIIGGSSAINLLGRFAHGDKNISQIAIDIAFQENKQNEEIIFAEIVHLPESRTGNVLLHPAFRNYEIPFLAKSSFPPEHQIALNDLYITVKNGNIKLFSKRLNKEIIPRLSNAHNFSHKSLPLYHFLCDLQTQKLRKNFFFHWGEVPSQFTFLPRVVFKDVILFVASWRFFKEDIEEIIKEAAINAGVIPEFISKWKLPRYVVLADGDNELLVDFKNNLSLETFLHTIKNKSAIILKEFFMGNKAVANDDKSGFYNNEFIASLIKTEKVYGNTINFREHNIQRSFSPGSEWVYYKLYCGVKSADTILLEAIYPLIVRFLSEKKIDKWFFVRYNDPEFHLRIRFHLTDKNHFGDFVKEFGMRISNFETENIIWKTQLDTYHRELDRYTGRGIELSETLFFKDSMQKLFFLKYTTGDDRENIRWLWGLKFIDILLDAFNFSLEQKYSLLKILKENFAKEFNANKELFQQLNKKYRLNKNTIQKIIDNEENEPIWQVLTQLFNKEECNFKNIARQILSSIEPEAPTLTINSLISSYIHMGLNRLFVSDARKQEMIIYDFLFQYYHTKVKRK